MTPPSDVPQRTAATPAAGASPTTASLLAQLADVSEALTGAIVAHDHDRIVAITAAADGLIGRLRRDAPGTPGLADAKDDRPDAPFAVPDPIVALLAARIGAAARRNALLLERAWATDAELLRLLAAAAQGDVEPAGTPTAAYAQPGADPGAASGWLDRTA